MHDAIHNAHLNLRPRAVPRRAHIAAYVVPQEYGIPAADKVGVGAGKPLTPCRHPHHHRLHHLTTCTSTHLLLLSRLQIASTMLHKIHDDMLAGMATESHERERVHRIDTSALSGTESINTPQRHVRTRLYFTSESHIFSLFNVLRWGAEATDGVTSIFNDECRAKFDAMEPCYLTHLVFRVLLRRGADQVAQLVHGASARLARRQPAPPQGRRALGDVGRRARVRYPRRRRRRRREGRGPVPPRRPPRGATVHGTDDPLVT